MKLRLLAVVTFLFLGVGQANAHAVVKDSTPATNALVQDPSPTFRVHFNSRIDKDLSKLTLIGPDKQRSVLPIDQASNQDTLFSHAAGLAPGAYRIRWQVLSVDGHITRGDIPFTVAVPVAPGH